MKLVATPRPEKNDWKSIVGPWIVALAPPAHSTWATLRPPRSALCAMVSALRTPGANADVLLPNGAPLMWNVLLVEPWTPGHAPLARLYQPAPVFGGAWVSRPSPVADAPCLRNEAIVGIRPLAAYFSTRSWRIPSDAKNTAVPGSGSWLGLPWASAAAGATAVEASRPMSTRTKVDRRSKDLTTGHLHTDFGHTRLRGGWRGPA